MIATEVVRDRFDPGLVLPASSLRMPGTMDGDEGITYEIMDEIGLDADLDGNDLKANARVLQEEGIGGLLVRPSCGSGGPMPAVAVIGFRSAVGYDRQASFV